MPTVDDYREDAENLSRDLDRMRSAYDLYATYRAAKEEIEAQENERDRAFTELTEARLEADRAYVRLRAFAYRLKDAERGQWLSPFDALCRAWLELLKEQGIEGAHGLATKRAREMAEEELHPNDLSPATVDRG